LFIIIKKKKENVNHLLNILNNVSLKFVWLEKA
jgi:hypothetical protein